MANDFWRKIAQNGTVKSVLKLDLDDLKTRLRCAISRSLLSSLLISMVYVMLRRGVLIVCH